MTVVADAARLARVQELRSELTTVERQWFIGRSGWGDRALEIEQAAAALGDEPLRRHAQLIQAHLLIQQGKSAAGARMVREINRWAQEHGEKYLLARSHCQLSSFFQVLGDNPLA